MRHRLSFSGVTKKRYLTVNASGADFLRIVARAILRWEVQVVREPPPKSWRSRLLKALDVRAFHLEKCTAVQLHSDSYAAGPRAASRLVSESISTRCQSEASSQGWSVAPVQISLFRELSKNPEEITIADSWARQYPHAKNRIRVPAQTMSILLREMHTPALVTPKPLWRHSSGRSQPEIHDDAIYQETFSNTSPCESKNSRSGWQALVVLNRDIKYGSLYSYEDLLPSDSTSMWSIGQVRFLSRTGGALSNGMPADTYPTPKSQVAIALTSVNTLIRLVLHPRSIRTGWHEHVFQQRAADVARVLRQRYPHARAALLAFDIQLPVYLIAGLEYAGIRTVALQERPAISFDHAASSIAGTILSASTFFAETLRDSPVVSSKNVIPVGMWRTDLLQTELQVARGGTPPKRPTVLVLPYHAEPPLHRPSDPMCTSIETLISFLSDILALAERHNDVHFMVRAKNADWLLDSRTTTERDAPTQLGNVTLDDNYSTLNRTYQLAAHSSLIIAKPTSLIDEALACGIPCVVHDYTHNASNYASSLLTYLPRRLWASDRAELFSKVQEILIDNVENPDVSNPDLVAIYGFWADGKVRQRIHAYLDGIGLDPNHEPDLNTNSGAPAEESEQTHAATSSPFQDEPLRPRGSAGRRDFP